MSTAAAVAAVAAVLRTNGAAAARVGRTVGRAVSAPSERAFRQRAAAPGRSTPAGALSPLTRRAFSAQAAAKDDKQQQYKDEHHAVVSVFDLFSIGIGPSSSHTVGPMRASKLFVDSLRKNGILPKVHGVRAQLYGSLALTGEGHGTLDAVLMGLENETPQGINTETLPVRVKAIRAEKKLKLGGDQVIAFDTEKHLLLHKDQTLPQHPNGMRFSAFGANGEMLATTEYFSIGGGFVVAGDIETTEDNAFYKSKPSVVETGRKQVIQATLPFHNAAELVEVCTRENMTIAQVVFENERRWRSDVDIKRGLLELWRTMDASITNGCWSTQSHLPGGLNVRRRAPQLFKRLMEKSLPVTPLDPTRPAQPSALVPRQAAKRKDLHTLAFLDWLSCFAIAVNEENACGGRVVTAPTNGAAGIIPATLKYYLSFVSTNHDEDVQEFLLTAAAIGMLFKKGASISAAEVGCQGEVGVACSMAAAALTAVMGGTVAQVENAAEIGMEHNLGLTCDPIGGLVQIPCIERNALGAAKAVTASQLALGGDGHHRVTLDQVIETMRQTGADMQSKYKETSLGGLAQNVPVC